MIRRSFRYALLRAIFAAYPAAYAVIRYMEPLWRGFPVGPITGPAGGASPGRHVEGFPVYRMLSQIEEFHPVYVHVKWIEHIAAFSRIHVVHDGIFLEYPVYPFSFIVQLLSGSGGPYHLIPVIHGYNGHLPVPHELMVKILPP